MEGIYHNNIQQKINCQFINNAIKDCKEKVEKNKKRKIFKARKNNLINDIPKCFNQKGLINNILLLLLIVIYSPIFISNKDIKNLRYGNSLWEITLIIKGTGNQKILCDENVKGYSFGTTPSEIIVNRVSQSDIGYMAYNLEKERNIITIKWNKSFKNCNVMFYGLSNLTEIDLSNFDSSSVTNMLKMFQGCTSLTSINFRNFNAEKVIDMRDAFAECSSLISLDLSNLVTSSLTKIDNMFYECSSLASLDLSNFITSKVVSMKQVFYGCRNIISLDLNNFITSSVTDMQGLFKDCKSLISLNIKNFDTSSLTNMNRMFSGCSKLELLDISNFHTSSVKNMEQVFYGCKALTSLDLSQFDTSSVTIMSNMFCGCNSLISLNLNNFVTSSVTNMMNMFNNCKKLISLKIDNFNTKKVTNMNGMFANCLSLISLNLNSFETPIVNDYNYMFANSNDDIICCLNEYKLPNISSLIILDNPNYKNNCSDICFSENAKILENKSCIYDCSSNAKYKMEYRNFCYENCPKGTHISQNNIFLCEENKICDTFEFFTNICKLSINQIDEKEMSEHIREELFQDSMNSLISNIFNDEKKDLLVKEENAIYQLTSSYNQYNKNYSNISTIKLGDCETILKKHYNISYNDSLLIYKVDLINESHISPIIEYELYDYKAKKELNLSLCKDIPIEIDIPVLINDKELFKYNLSSDYYSDRCFPYTTEKGTDIILSDRKKEYFQNNMSVCEQNCIFENYDKMNKKAICKCKVKETFQPRKMIEFDTDILKELVNIKNVINIYVMKCYKLFLSKDGLIKNIGNYSLLLIILSNIALLLYFLFKEFNYLNIIISEIIKSENKEKKIKGKSKKDKKKKTIFTKSKTINSINRKIVSKKKHSKEKIILIKIILKSIRSRNK